MHVPIVILEFADDTVVTPRFQEIVVVAVVGRLVADIEAFWIGSVHLFETFTRTISAVVAALPAGLLTTQRKRVRESAMVLAGMVYVSAVAPGMSTKLVVSVPL